MSAFRPFNWAADVDRRAIIDAAPAVLNVPAELKTSPEKERVTPFFESTKAILSPAVWQAVGQT